MRIVAGLFGLLVGGILFAADAPTIVTIKPGGTGTVKLGQTVHLSYPYKKDETVRLKRLIIEKKNVLGLKELRMGAETSVIYNPTKIGTFKVDMEVFIEPLENARVEKYTYTLVVKKKGDDD